MNSQASTWRFSILGGILFSLPVLIVLQMVRIQVNPEWVKEFLVAKQFWSQVPRTIEPARGQIYDRRGNLMAGNKTVYEVGVELAQVSNPRTIAEVLNAVLNVDYADVLAAASITPSNNAVYAVIKDGVTPEEIEKLKALMDQVDLTYANSKTDNPPSMSGVVYHAHLARTYPEKSLASNLLGFVLRGGVGVYGVEEKYNDLLAGTSRTVMVPLDPNRVQELPYVPDGATLILTIDREIQRSMEELLDDSIEETGSDSGTIVVLDPKTGELLALATTPRLDLNQFEKYEEVFTKGTPFNRGASGSYEPGSVYKVLTMASALDAGAVTPDTVFIDTGVIEIGGLRIYNWNLGAWGPQDMQGCLQHSLNVCLAWVATQLGRDKFYQYMQEFGIGHLTGIDLGGEVSGRLKAPGDSDWYDADLGTNAFGQGVSATPVQMAMAIAAVANDGKVMVPHVVRSIVNEGFQQDIGQRVLSVPIREETADLLSEILARSLETESSDALVTGYRVAGKTGTAEIPTPLGYTTNETNASFVGWGPVDDPQFLIYIWLERPSTSPWGSVVAAPVFREAVEELVILLNLPPDDVRLQLSKSTP